MARRPLSVCPFSRHTGEYAWHRPPKGAGSFQRQTTFGSANGRLYYADMSCRLYWMEEKNPTNPVLKAQRGGAGTKDDREALTAATLATIFGMLPLAFAIGAGAEMRAPMARAVIGGLITSTLLTLIVVPVVYTNGPRGAGDHVGEGGNRRVCVTAADPPRL